MPIMIKRKPFEIYFKGFSFANVKIQLDFTAVFFGLKEEDNS